jgi:Uma2 family endonuclease
MLKRMAIPAEKKRYTAAEYLTLESKAVDKHEYHAGEMLAMSGGAYHHSRVNVNFSAELVQRLKGKPCFTLESNMRLRLAASDRYVYPDAMVVCGDPIFDPLDKNQTTIINPTVVIEVLSDSTEAYDRGDKFTAYRDLPTLQEYVLVSQNRPMVESFLRQEDGTWVLAAFQGLDGSATLRSIKIQIPLSDIYTGLDFTQADGSRQ